MISSRLTDNIYSKTNTEGVLLGIQEDYATCLQLRVKKLRVRLEQDLNSWRNASTAAKNEMQDYAEKVSIYMNNQSRNFQRILAPEPLPSTF